MNISANRTIIIQLITAVMLAMPVSGAPSSPAASDSISYEIPLSDLKKVEKKKKTRKLESKPRKEKKHGGSTSQKTLHEAEEKSYPVAMPEIQELRREVVPEQPPQITSINTATPQSEADDTRIIHEPYSYVVTGKYTIVKAVFSSRYTLKSVQCRFRSSETGGYAIVPMAKEDGSQYTYAAILPALAEKSQYLRYRFVAIDSQAKETLSQEFVTPVNHASIVPGWQQEPSQTVIKIELENPEKPLEGFIDTTAAK